MRIYAPKTYAAEIAQMGAHKLKGIKYNAEKLNAES